MRLVLKPDPGGLWAQLECDSSAEMEALEDAVSQGARTLGRAPGAIEELRALAARLGYPVPSGPPEQRPF